MFRDRITNLAKYTVLVVPLEHYTIILVRETVLEYELRTEPSKQFY